MVRLRPLLAVAAAVAMQVLLLDRVALWHVSPSLLPALVFLIGVEAGPDWGAGLGLFAGALLFLMGGGPWAFVLYALLGGVAGGLFHSDGGFWGNWLRFLPVAAGLEGLLVLSHWPARAAMSAALAVAGPELLLAALCFPLAALFAAVALKRPRPKRHAI